MTSLNIITVVIIQMIGDWYDGNGNGDGDGVDDGQMMVMVMVIVKKRSCHTSIY